MHHNMGDSVISAPADVRASEPWGPLYGPHRASYVKCYDEQGPTYVMTARGGRVLQHATLVHQGKVNVPAETPHNERKALDGILSSLDERIAAHRARLGWDD